MIGDLLGCLLAVAQLKNLARESESKNSHPLRHAISNVLIPILVFYINNKKLFLGGSLYSLQWGCRLTGPLVPGSPTYFLS